MYKLLNSQVWETPLANMEVEDGKAKIPEVPVLSTGQWKGTLIAEKNLNEVCDWQKKQGPVHVVQDHLEDVGNFTGLADDFRIVEDPRGFKVIVADLEIIDEPLIKKLELMKEKGGGFAGISPRIDWEKRDADGNVEGLTAPHVSIVIHPAQGQITGLSDSLEDEQPNICKCPSCGTTIEKERGVPCSKKECPKCGSKMVGVRLKEGMMKDPKKKFGADDLKMIKCPKCGTTNPEGSEKCRKCGAKLAKEEPEDKKKKKDEKDEMAAEEYIIPASLRTEMEQIAANEKADASAYRAFITKMNEQMKKKEPEEEEPEEGEEEQEGKEKKEKDYPYPYPKKQSYAFPAKPETEKVADADHKWKKELLPQGLFMHPAGVGLLPIGEDFIDAVVANTKSVFGEKQIPVTIGHPQGEIKPDKTVGWLGDFSKDKSLYGVIEITNKLVSDAIDDTTLRDCSLGINLDYVDEHGKLVGPVITHLALTNLPYFKKLSEFEKLAASEDVHVDKLDPVKGMSFVDKETMEKIEAMQKQFEDVSEKYAEMLKQVIDSKKEACLTELDGLVEAELVRSGAKERFAEFVEKTSDKMFDDKRSVAEVFVDLLKTGLLKSDVALSSTVSVGAGEGKEALSRADFAAFDIAALIRSGKIAHDEKGRPYWKEGRPTE